MIPNDPNVVMLELVAERLGERQGQPRHLLLRNDALTDSDNLPTPDVIAQEIVDDLEAALEQFREVLADLRPDSA